MISDKRPPTRGKRRGQAATSPLIDPSPDAIVPKRDAIGYLAARVALPNDNVRSARNRVRQRVDRAINRGDLRARERDSIVFGEFVTWARSVPEWSSALEGVPGTVIAPASSIQTAARFGTPRSYGAPADDENLRAAYRRAQERIHELEQVNAELRGEIAALRPDAEAYRNVRESARRNAGRPRPKDG